MIRKIDPIDEVLVQLEEIIHKAENTNCTFGYFTVLYHKVTLRVKEGIENNLFENGPEWKNWT